MFRSFLKLASFLVIISLFAVSAFAQSGRGRTQPAPKPTPKPELPKTTVLGIPDGGKLVRQDLDNATSRFALRNGLTVLVRERHSAPLVVINITVNAGILSEPDESAGIARLVQKAILRGTDKLNGAAVEKEVARLGGVFTSEVNYDRTIYTLIAPAESYNAMVELLADIFLHPALTDDELKKAAAEVLLDSKRTQDNVEQSSMEKLFAAAFTTHRLKRGSAVSERFLSSVTRDQVMAFYQSHYQPAKTVITVLGDIFTLNAIGQVQLRFGNYKSLSAAPPVANNKQAASSKQPAAGKERKAQPNEVSNNTTQNPSTPTTGAQAAENQPVIPVVQATTLEEAAQEKLRYGNARADIGESLVTIAYRTPALKSDKEGLKELAAMQVLAAVLGLGDGSRLHQGLRDGLASRDKLSVTSEVGMSYESYPNVGLLISRMWVEPNRIDRAEAEYFREIERFRREIISEGELQRAKSLLEKAHYDAIANFEDEAELVSRYQSRFNDWRLFDSALNRLRAVTAQDVQQIAAKYLTLAGTTVAEYESLNATARTFTPEKFAELIVTFAPEAVQPASAIEAKPAIALKSFAQGAERNPDTDGQNIIVASVPLPVKDFSVLRGPRAYVREDKSLPLLSVSVLFQGGRLIEDQTNSGTTELMLRTMAKSTTTRKSDLIALELEAYGGQLHIINEPDFFGFTLDVLSRNAENAVKLLLDAVENPYFGKEEVAREKTILLADQLRHLDDDNARAGELLSASLYPGHPYGLPRYGLSDVVKTTTEEKLEEWYGKTIKRQYPLVVLVGDTDGSALVSRIFSEGLKRGDLDKSLKVSLPSLQTSPDDKWEQRARVVTTQAIGFRTAPAMSPQSLNQNKQPDDYYAMELLATMASSGKLSEEVQTKQGLIDSLRIKNQPRLASGMFTIRFVTLPENESKAREVLLAELDKLAANPPSDSEFELGRNAAIGRYAIALQANPARALEYARAVFFNRDPKDVESQPDGIRTVKKSDIKRVADKLKIAGRGVVRAKQ